ncbi:MAG: nucleoside-diphosphate sugar epimerase/dehydratase [Pseudomonadota bacterium]
MNLPNRLLGLPRPGKLALAMIVDAAICGLTVWLSFYLRLGVVAGITPGVRIATAAAIVIALPTFYLVGLYSAVFRFTGSDTLVRLARGCFIFGVAYSSIFAIMGIPGVPRTVGLIEPILLMLAVGLSRTSVSYALGGRRRGRRRDDCANILVYGAGAAGRQLVSAISQSVDMNVVGFLDDNRVLQGRRLDNVPVYSPASVSALVTDLKVGEILLAFPSIARQRRNEIIRSLQSVDVRIRTLPGLMDFAHGRVQIADLKPLEIEDLLGRDVVAPDPALLARTIAGKVVMVTGAGGSIGSELCRQIVRLGPTSLLLLESSEYALYAIHYELDGWARREGVAIRIIPLLGSVRDDARVRTIIEAWRPETVYHAAAYKHVPLVEHNPIEGIWNNVFGTLTAAQAAFDLGVANFVLISTDKAVRPTNIMGTSKRLAEMLLQSMAAGGRAGRTCVSMVRFGNVLGSSGSVVPLFRQQIAANGPITITDPEITRYFMTIPEAAQLVIQAGAMAIGGEVFVLHMGDPVRIVDLARNMVELSGLTVRDTANPDGDIALEFVGLRPGEKLYEELLIGDDPEATAHQKIMKANEQFPTWPEFELALGELAEALDRSDVAGAKAMLHRLVPEYATTSDLVDWVTMRRGQ